MYIRKLLALTLALLMLLSLGGTSFAHALEDGAANAENTEPAAQARTPSLNDRTAIATPEPTPTATPEPTPTATPEPTPTATPEPTPTATPEPTVSPEPSAEPAQAEQTSSTPVLLLLVLVLAAVLVWFWWSKRNRK